LPILPNPPVFSDPLWIFINISDITQLFHGLLCGAGSAVLIQYGRVMDRQTDRQTDRYRVTHYTTLAQRRVVMNSGTVTLSTSDDGGHETLQPEIDTRPRRDVCRSRDVTETLNRPRPIHVIMIAVLTELILLAIACQSRNHDVTSST